MSSFTAVPTSQGVYTQCHCRLLPFEIHSFTVRFVCLISIWDQITFDQISTQSQSVSQRMYFHTV